jgi:pSer/pThr/pTyr-binding forkhead associated (FHA) protein
MDIPKMKMAKEFYELIGQNKTEKTKEIYKMIVKSGPLTGKEILLTSDEIVFGRNEFFPSNKLISRRHFKLVFDGNNYFIIDTSVNGTFLNIQKINKSVLSDKDKIILGNNEVELLFRKE